MKAKTNYTKNINTTSSLFFKVTEGQSKTYPKGRSGYLINKSGERIPFKVIYCSMAGEGVIQMTDTYYKKQRA
jgi:hypothetical protein